MTIKYFITGASGWIGTAFVRYLIETQNVDVSDIYVLIMQWEDPTFFEKRGIKYFKGDLSDTNSLEQFMELSQGNILVHLAGLIHPRFFSSEFNKINYIGTMNIIEIAKKYSVKQAVVMSSNSPIGVSTNSNEIFDESSSYNPYMGYGYSKMLAEKYLLRSDNKVPVTIIRAPWFYGPNQPERQSLFFQMIKDGVFPIFGDGSNKRSMAYIDNLAYGLFLCCDNDLAYNQVFWIADERPYSMNQIINTVQEVLVQDFEIKVIKCKSFPEVIPNTARLVDSVIQKVGLYNQKIHVLGEMNLTIACNVNKAQQILGYNPKIELRAGMRNSITWMIENGYVFR